MQNIETQNTWRIDGRQFSKQQMVGVAPGQER